MQTLTDYEYDPKSDPNLERPARPNLLGKTLLKTIMVFGLLLLCIGAVAIVIVIIMGATKNTRYSESAQNILLVAGLGVLFAGCWAAYSGWTSYSNNFTKVAQGRVLAKNYGSGEAPIFYIILLGYTRAGEVCAYRHVVEAIQWIKYDVGDYARLG